MAEYFYFRFIIKNEKYKLYRRIAAFIFLLLALAFFYASMSAVSSFQRFLLILVGSLLFINTLYAFFSKNESDRSYIGLYLIAAMVWFTEIGGLFPPLILIVLMVLQLLAQTRISLSVSREGVILKSYSENEYTWNEIENMVLRDGLLTVNLSNNKMIQLEADFNLPVTVRKGGSHSDVKWLVGEDYPELEKAVNEFAEAHEKMENAESTS